jgi:hypothetical protein
LSEVIRFADKFDFGLGGKDIPNRMPQDRRIIGYENFDWHISRPPAR